MRTMSTFPGRFFSSQSTTSCQSDKLCDRISDSIVDFLLEVDPIARVSCDVAIGNNLIAILGEISSQVNPPYSDIVRTVIEETGYLPETGFDLEKCSIVTSISEQSPDIARALDHPQSDMLPAGDTCTVVGFACTDTPEFMPAPISLAHRLCRGLESLRRDGSLSFLRPDGKAEVTVEYSRGSPLRVSRVTLLAQHEPSIEIVELREQLKKSLIEPTLTDYLDSQTLIYINPTGRFVEGGPEADSGMTGRKNLVDTYGGMARGGGGALSGKGPSKIHRVGTYLARHIAKSIVATGLAKHLEVRLTYAIGLAKPLAVDAFSYGTSDLSDERLASLITQKFDVRPGAAIEKFSLRNPIYYQTACFGHLGRPDIEFPWERTEPI